MDSFITRRITMNGTIATLHPWVFDAGVRTVDYGPSLKRIFRALGSQGDEEASGLAFVVGIAGEGKTEFAKAMEVFNSSVLHIDPVRFHSTEQRDGVVDLGDVAKRYPEEDKATIYVVDEVAMFTKRSVIEFIHRAKDSQKSVVLLAKSFDALPAIPEASVLAFSREEGLTPFRLKHVRGWMWNEYERWTNDAQMSEASPA